MNSADMRKRAEALIDAYYAKCDKVYPDGSTGEDHDRDLLDPIIALCAEAAESARADAIAELLSGLRSFTPNSQHCIRHSCNSARGWKAIIETVIEHATTAKPGSAQAADVPSDEWVLVPKEPSEGRLISMAIRSDHGLGVPGFYDQKFLRSANNGATHLRIFNATIGTMRQLYEEATGQGFYRPEREEEYKAMLSASQREREGKA